MNLIDRAQLIRNETTAGANTAERLGSLLEDISTISNSVNLLSDLQAYDDVLTNGIIVYLRGVNTIGDLGRGFFRWDATSEETADNGLIVAVNGVPTGRFKRIADDNVGFIEWYVGDDITDPIANMQALRDLNIAGFAIKLQNLYPIGTGSEGTTYPNEEVRIFSEDKERFGLILETIHATSGSQWTDAYFMNTTVRYSFENISFYTRNYINEIALEYNVDHMYKLFLGNDSGQSELIFENCNIYGNIRCVTREGATWSKIIVKNCNIEQISQLIFGDLIGDAVFANNNVKDCAGTIIRVFLSGSATRFFVLNNLITNSQVYSLTGGYFIPFMMRGQGMGFLKGNHVEYWLSSDIVSNSTNDPDPEGSECAFWDGYNAYIHDNTVINLLSHRKNNDDNSLLHWKVGGFGDVRNNYFRVEKQCLYDIGLIVDGVTDYEDILYSDFTYAGLFQNGANTASQKLTYMNNEIYIPFKNAGAHMYWHEIIFKNNYIEIDYVAESGTSNTVSREIIGVGHATTSTVYEGNYLHVENNTFRVNNYTAGASNIGIFSTNYPFIGLSENYTQFSEYLIFNKNTLIANNINFLIGKFYTPKAELVDNVCLGNNSSLRLNSGIHFNGVAQPNTIYDNKNSDSNILRQLYTNGNSKFINRVYNNSQNEIQLFESNLQEFQYADTLYDVNNPLLLKISIEYEDINQVFHRDTYNLAITADNELRYRNTSNVVSIIDMRNSTEDEAFVRCKSNPSTDLILRLFSDTGRGGTITVSEISDYSKLKITTITIPAISVDSGTFYNSYL